MSGYLIKDTTREERKKIVEESLEMYNDYIDGKREIRDINMEFNARYVKGDMEKDNGRSCPM